MATGKGEEIRCMLETSKGEILMGTTQGVYRYEPETKKHEQILS